MCINWGLKAKFFWPNLLLNPSVKYFDSSNCTLSPVGVSVLYDDDDSVEMGFFYQHVAFKHFIWTFIYILIHKHTPAKVSNDVYII